MWCSNSDFPKFFFSLNVIFCCSSPIVVLTDIILSDLKCFVFWQLFAVKKHKDSDNKKCSYKRKQSQ